LSARTAGTACPQCEYTRRGFGKPRDCGDGLWQCAECGGHWREIAAPPPLAAMPEALPVNEPAPDFADRLAMLRRKAGQASKKDLGGISGSGRSAKARRIGFAQRVGFVLRFSGAAGAVMAGWVGMAAIWPAHNADWQARDWMARLLNPIQAITGHQNNALELSSVRASRPDEGSLDTVRVEGRITNRSQSPQPLGTFNIVVTDAEGNEIAHWHYRPALARLKPGQTIRFASTQGGVPAPARDVKIRFASLTWTAGL